MKSRKEKYVKVEKTPKRHVWRRFQFDYPGRTKGTIIKLPLFIAFKINSQNFCNIFHTQTFFFFHFLFFSTSNTSIQNIYLYISFSFFLYLLHHLPKTITISYVGCNHIHALTFIFTPTHIRTLAFTVIFWHYSPINILMLG